MERDSENIPIRGDGFDIGQRGEAFVQRRPGESTDIIPSAQQIAGFLRINEKQADNLRSAFVGTGTGAFHRLLSEYIGDVPAAMLGAGITAWFTSFTRK